MSRLPIQILMSPGTMNNTDTSTTAESVGATTNACVLRLAQRPRLPKALPVLVLVLLRVRLTLIMVLRLVAVVNILIILTTADTEIATPASTGTTAVYN